jgi:hypothetical protein
MNEFHASRAIANIEKRVVLLGCSVKAKPADGLIGPFSEHTFLEVVVAVDQANDITILHPGLGESTHYITIFQKTAAIEGRGQVWKHLDTGGLIRLELNQ